MGGFERTRSYVQATKDVAAILVVTTKPENRHIADTLISPREMGFTGSQCTVCNSMKMIRNGHCEVCIECGTSTGCS